jgi:hypothetical protein
MHRTLLILAAAFAFATPLRAQHPPATDSLAALATDPAPWLHLEAGSEQRPPVYLGARPREMELGLPPADGGRAALPESLKALGERQLKNLWQQLTARKLVTAKKAITVEAWPTRDDRSRLTWAFARWRASAADPWRWLPPSVTLNTDPNGFLPRLYDPAVASDHFAIFADVLAMGIYDKPIFGDCVWVTRDADTSLAAPIEAWLPTSWREAYGRRGDLAGRLAYQLPQPARLNGRPITLHLTVQGDRVSWPETLVWTSDPALPPAVDRDRVIANWPGKFAEEYRADVLALDAETGEIFAPLAWLTKGYTRYPTPDPATLPRKNNAQAPNQLDEIVTYLEARYADLRLRTWRETVQWRGAPQTMLFAEIPGSDPDAAPVLMADHIDTAFAEDVYHRTGQRVSVPGADDNVTATAALLRAAEVLRDVHPQRPIWLVHLTGEEFPADCLGARQVVSNLLGDERDIAALVLLDMIGYADGTRDPLFQLSPGDSEASLAMAAIALDVVADLNATEEYELRPLLEPRFSDRSYLYNTDGVIFADAGYPVLLVNEHLNYYSTLMREAYHDSTDTSHIINFDYATAVTKVAIETVARLAGAPGAPP